MDAVRSAGTARAATSIALRIAIVSGNLAPSQGDHTYCEVTVAPGSNLVSRHSLTELAGAPRRGS